MKFTKNQRMTIYLLMLMTIEKRDFQGYMYEGFCSLLSYHPLFDIDVYEPSRGDKYYERNKDKFKRTLPELYALKPSSTIRDYWFDVGDWKSRKKLLIQILEKEYGK